MRADEARHLATFEDLEGLARRLSGYGRQMGAAAGELAALRGGAPVRHEIATLEVAAADLDRAARIAEFLGQRSDRLDLLREPVPFRRAAEKPRAAGARS